jgi:hypothetical protein
MSSAAIIISMIVVLVCKCIFVSGVILTHIYDRTNTIFACFGYDQWQMVEKCQQEAFASVATSALRSHIDSSRLQTVCFNLFFFVVV